MSKASSAMTIKGSAYSLYYAKEFTCDHIHQENNRLRRDVRNNSKIYESLYKVLCSIGPPEPLISESNSSYTGDDLVADMIQMSVHNVSVASSSTPEYMAAGAGGRRPESGSGISQALVG